MRNCRRNAFAASCDLEFYFLSMVGGGHGPLVPVRPRLPSSASQCATRTRAATFVARGYLQS